MKNRKLVSKAIALIFALTAAREIKWLSMSVAKSF